MKLSENIQEFEIKNIRDKLTIKHVIIDLSCTNSIDIMGEEAIIKVSLNKNFTVVIRVKLTYIQKKVD